MKLVEKMKAKFLIQDELQKLLYLSDELIEGRATRADASFWDESLDKLEGYTNHLPQFENILKKYKTRRECLMHSVRVQAMEHYTGSVFAASAIKGNFDTLRLQRSKNEQEGDIVIVMGNWMASEDDVDSIQKAMDLAEEGVLFIKGKTEEAYLAKHDDDSLESFFIQTLPTDVRTPYIIITTGDSENEPMPMDEWINSKEPNLTNKTLIVMNPAEGGESFSDNKRQLIVLAPGEATRLALKRKH